MEIPVSVTPINITNCSTSLPEVAQTELSGQLWRQIYAVVVSVVATPANLIVIVCLWRNRSSEVTGFSTYAVAVAFTDLLVGLVLMPFKFLQATWSRWPSGLTNCIVWKVIDTGLICVSVLLFLAMGYDRYRCVTAPFRYRSQFRTTRIIQICVSLWIVGFLLWIPYILLKILVYDEEYYKTSCPIFTFGDTVFETIHIIVAYYIPLVALIAMNTILLKRLNTRISRLRKLKSTANSRQSPVNISTVSGMIGHHSAPCKPETMRVSRGHMSKNRCPRAISSYKIVILIVVFCVFWLPHFITYPINGLCRTCISDETRAVFGFFTYGQSAINPLIVISTSRPIRSKLARFCTTLSATK